MAGALHPPPGGWRSHSGRARGRQPPNNERGSAGGAGGGRRSSPPQGAQEHLLFMMIIHDRAASFCVRPSEGPVVGGFAVSEYRIATPLSRWPTTGDAREETKSKAVAQPCAETRERSDRVEAHGSASAEKKREGVAERREAKPTDWRRPPTTTVPERSGAAPTVARADRREAPRGRRGGGPPTDRGRGGGPDRGTPRSRRAGASPQPARA